MIKKNNRILAILLFFLCSEKIVFLYQISIYYNLVINKLLRTKKYFFNLRRKINMKSTSTTVSSITLRDLRKMVTTGVKMDRESVRNLVNTYYDTCCDHLSKVTKGDRGNSC